MRGDQDPSQLPPDTKFSLIIEAVNPPVNGIDKDFLHQNFANLDLLNNIAVMLQSSGQEKQISKVTDLIRSLFPEINYTVVKEKNLHTDIAEE